MIENEEYILAANVERLDRIRSYWRARGRRIELHLARVNGYLCDKSDLVGGLPR